MAGASSSVWKMRCSPLFHTRRSSGHTYSQPRVVNSLGVEFHSIALSSNRLPLAPAVLDLIELLEAGPHPVLLHCDAGADRTGLASGVARIVIGRSSAAEARAELSARFGHISLGPTGELDRFFVDYEQYLEMTRLGHNAVTFKHWMSATDYSPLK